VSQREDLLARLTELDAGSQARRATARSIQKMINHGDYAGATTALDDLETALHPALAAGSGPGGSGLPEQWTDGGNGDVTATVDDPTKTPFTIDGDVGQSEALLVLNEDDDGSNYNDVLVIVGDKGGLDESNIFSIDSAGQVFITTKDVGATGLDITTASGAAAFGAHILVVTSDPVAPGTLLDVEASGKFSVGNAGLPNGLLLHGPHAAPTDGEINFSGDIVFWFDQTNGAPALNLKAKQANGTVVTKRIPLDGLGVAPANADYVVGTANGALSGEMLLSNITKRIGLSQTDNTANDLTVNMPNGSFDNGTAAVVVNPDLAEFPAADPILTLDHNGIQMFYPQGQATVSFAETDATGTVAFSPDQGVHSEVSGTNATALSLSFGSGNTPNILLGALLEARGFGSSKFDVRITRDGVLVTGHNAAPADGSLNNGDAGLWFDSTNGAAKLMIKAKTANGTVVTGQVALS
jgi:hypothetical protein